jgi:P4 family phage/plasmid primase-like protien
MSNLAPEILATLEESGIPVSYGERMGLSVVTAAEALAESGTKHEVSGSAIRIPYPGSTLPNGSPYCRFRLLAPTAGAPKYIGASGQDSAIYFPPGFDELPTDAICITEGEKKAAAATAHGIPCIGIAGVFNWFDPGYRAKEKAEGKSVSAKTLPDAAIMEAARKATNIYVIGDSDLQHKPAAKKGLECLAQSLQSHLDIEHAKQGDEIVLDPTRNVMVHLVILPPNFSANGEEKKVGLDDYIVSLRTKQKEMLSDPMHESEITPRVGRILREHIEALAFAETQATEYVMAKIVAQASYESLAARGQVWMAYEPQKGIWSRTTASQEMATLPRLTQKFKSLTGTYNNIVHTSLAPFVETPEDDWPAPAKRFNTYAELRRKAMAPAALMLQKTKTMKDILTQVRPMLSIAEDRWDAKDTDHLLPVANGVIDLRSGAFSEHSYAHLVTQGSIVKYDPLATCPRFQEFLDQCVPDKPTQKYLQALFGYTATGHINMQQAYLLTGSGGNGKSTLINLVMKYVLGDFGAIASKSTVIAGRNEAHPTNLASLRGKRLVSLSELDANTMLDAASLKHLTGGGDVTARRMREDFTVFTPKWKIVIDTNDIPLVREAGPAMRRRLVCIDFSAFSVDYSGKDESRKLNEDLEKEIGESEASGILNWVIDGARAYYNEKALHPDNIPDAVKESTAKIWPLIDLATQWLEDTCVVETGTETDVKILYKSFREWCEASGINGDRIKTQNAFSRDLRRASIGQRRSHGKTFLTGIRLRTSAESEMLTTEPSVETPIERKPVQIVEGKPAATTKRRVM